MWLDLDAGAKGNSGTFQQRLDEFKSLTWEQASLRTSLTQFDKVVNEAVVDAIKKCTSEAFEYMSKALDTLHQIVIIETQDPPDSFLLTIRAKFPSGSDQGLRIDNIEPTGVVTCSQAGNKILFPFTISPASNDALLSCTKPRDLTVLVSLKTNAGALDKGINVPGTKAAPQEKVAARFYIQHTRTGQYLGVCDTQRPTNGMNLACLVDENMHEELGKWELVTANANGPVYIRYVKTGLTTDLYLSVENYAAVPWTEIFAWPYKPEQTWVKLSLSPGYFLIQSQVNHEYLNASYNGGPTGDCRPSLASPFKQCVLPGPLDIAETWAFRPAK